MNAAHLLGASRRWARPHTEATAAAAAIRRKTRLLMINSDYQEGAEGRFAGDIRASAD